VACSHCATALTGLKIVLPGRVIVWYINFTDAAVVV